LRKCDQFKKNLSALQNPDLTQSVIEIKHANLCPIFYNQAVVLFHQKQPYSALKLMKGILQHIDQLENKFLQKVGLLTACLLLDTNQARKADQLIDMLQTRLDINNDDILMPDDLLEPELEKVKETLDEEQETFRNLFRLVLIRSFLLNGKNAIIPLDETSNFSILKAHQFYLGNDFQMASRELAKQFKNELITVTKDGEDQNVCIGNNMGLIHFSVKHYALAVRFFQQALIFDQKALETVKKEYGNQFPLHCLGATKRQDILYNLGIALLYLQRPKDAFDCLLVPLNIYHKNPKLWLRLAEACIMVHKQHLKEQELQNKNIISSVIGSGIHRKFIITPTPQKYVNDEPGSSAIPSPNLEFASLCLRNALTLINYYSQLANCFEFDGEKQGSGNGKNETFSMFGNNWNKVNESIPCNPSKPLTKTAIEKLKLHILTASSYVALQLGDYTLALQYAKDLVKIENLPDTHKLLGLLYAAEASIMLEKVTEAIYYLDPKIMNELKSDDFAMRSSPDWNINSIEKAHAIIGYNLIVSLVIFGDHDLARARLLTLPRHPIILHRVKMLELYLHLQAGNIEGCKKMIAAEHQY
jgi:CCR4-NOT transcription complex subunit 10